MQLLCTVCTGQGGQPIAKLVHAEDISDWLHAGCIDRRLLVQKLTHRLSNRLAVLAICSGAYRQVHTCAGHACLQQLHQDVYRLAGRSKRHNDCSRHTHSPVRALHID